MAIWAIVPVKPLRRGKSRLSSVLDEENREALNHCLLENTLETLKSIPAIEQVLVISRDPRALSLARVLKVMTVQESGAPELNQALERATLFVQRFAVNSVLILPADLPLINTLDIEAVLEAGQVPPVVVIAPDRHRQGTNAMLVSPPGLFRYRYGKNSFYKHSSAAIAAGARLVICERVALGLDLDTAEDLELVRNHMVLLKNGEFDQWLLSTPPADFIENSTGSPENPCLEVIRTKETGGKGG